MAYHCFVDKRFSQRSKDIIEVANYIINEYQDQGLSLTLRQLYYQFVSKDIIPNKDSEYKKLGNIINDARLAGYIDWDAFEDRTRFVRENNHFSSPKELLEIARRSYAIDKWKDQPYHIEVWIEKDALVGVIENTCRSLDIPFFSCRGYSSQSEMYKSAQRLKNKMIHEDKQVIILHLGDHDPSGIDMSWDIWKRLNLLSDIGWESQSQIEGIYDKHEAMTTKTFGIDNSIIVKRIALNQDQIKQYAPPPNPAKITDTRAKAYISMHGKVSWELDALSPRVLDTLIRDNVKEYRDEELWNEALNKEHRENEEIESLIDSLNY
jgi:hypothetical protein